MGQERTVMFQLPSVLSGTLACIAGTVAGRSWDLSAGTFVIGRMDTCDLQLPSEPGVSKTHAKIVAEGEHYVLADCESRNGTIVNGSPVQRVTLKDGDEIRVCGCVLRFTQRGGTGNGIKVRNVDRAAEEISAPAGMPPAAPSGGASFGGASSGGSQPRMPPPAVPAESFPSLTVPAEPPPPPKSRVLAMWYAGGLVSTLLFGGALSAVLVFRSAPAQAEQPPKTAALVAPVATPPPAPPPVAAPPPPVAPPPVATPPADDAKAADATKPPDATPPADDAAPDKTDKPEKAVASSSSRNNARGNGGNNGGGSRRSSSSSSSSSSESGNNAGAASEDGEGKAFGAIVEGGKSDTVRAKSGKVKSVEAKDGDTVQKGQVLVVFDEANGDEIQSLRDRIDSLKGTDDDAAKAQLKEAKEKLAALQGKSGGPVVASMSGKLTNFSVASGTVLRSGEAIGRIVEGDTPKKVRVTVDRNTKTKRGQSVILLLKRGGEGQGTIASVNGRTVVVDTGDLTGDEVEAVKFP